MTIIVFEEGDAVRLRLGASIGREPVTYAATFSDALQAIPACRAFVYARPLDTAGLEFLKGMRDENPNMPVVALAAAADVGEATALLRGRQYALATDYIDIDAPDLVSRLQAALTSRYMLAWRGIEVRPSEKMAYYNGEPLPLTPTEAALLAQFVRQPGITLDYEVLSEAAYNVRLPDAEAKRKLKTHLWGLRKKLREALGEDIILTRTGYGFVLV